jgi:hypothetical protein
MQSFVLAAFAGIANAFSNQMHNKFHQYMSEHGKDYNSLEEYEFRIANFAANDQFIQEHNASGANFTVGHNKMSDWATWEYKNILTHKPMPES